MPAQVRRILSTILAGIVTPALAMLFDEFGTTLYQADVRALTYSLFWDFTLLTAVILGAPFAIPVALAVRLRNAWGAVPFIAIVAAFGIEVQIVASRFFADLDTISVLLMLVWIVPAILGTLTAILLKWRPLTTSLAIAAIAMSMLIYLTIGYAKLSIERAPAYAAAKTWSTLRVGMKTFAGGQDAYSGLTVCPTLATLLAGQLSDQCQTISFGAPAIVDAIIPCKRTDPTWGYESPHVRLHATDGSWAGFTRAANLQPDIPVGTLIELARLGDAPLTMDGDHGTHTAIGDRAMVKLLRYDPRKEESLYVEILNGEHRGQRGWMWSGEADTGGTILGEYPLQYPNGDCMDL
jgi:hypothetical protein